MADDNGDEEAEEPIVELGEGESVEGVPIAQVAARLHYGIPRSKVEDREGDSVIRTPDGPRELGDVLAETDETFFSRRQDLVETVREVIGRGPVPTADE